MSSLSSLHPTGSSLESGANGDILLHTDFKITSIRLHKWSLILIFDDRRALTLQWQPFVSSKLGNLEDNLKAIRLAWVFVFASAV